MKVVLEAFGKLKSDVMDIPDNSTPYWDIVLSQPIQAIHRGIGEVTDEIPKIGARCRFEWTGKSYALEDGGFARIYVLKDIEKV